MLDKFSKLVKHHSHPESPRPNKTNEDHLDKPQTSPRRNTRKNFLIRAESEKPDTKKERKKRFTFKKHKTEKMTGTLSSDDSTAGSSFTTMTSPVVRRTKYVKATPPPPVETKETEEVTEDEVSLPESKGVFAAPEMTQEEKRREILDKNRKNSLTTYLERQKEQRSELTEQKRRQSKDADREKVPPSLTLPPSSSASKIFSVQPQFPEHKRSIDDPVVDEDGTILVKKMRKKDEEEEAKTNQDKEAKTETPQPSDNLQPKEDFVQDIDRTTTGKYEWDDYMPSSFTGWLKVVVPVLAITTVVAVKVYQRKK